MAILAVPNGVGTFNSHRQGGSLPPLPIRVFTVLINAWQINFSGSNPALPILFIPLKKAIWGGALFILIFKGN